MWGLPFNPAAISVPEESENANGDEKVVTKMAKVMTVEMMMMLVAMT